MIKETEDNTKEEYTLKYIEEGEQKYLYEEKSYTEWRPITTPFSISLTCYRLDLLKSWGRRRKFLGWNKGKEAVDEIFIDIGENYYKGYMEKTSELYAFGECDECSIIRFNIFECEATNNFARLESEGFGIDLYIFLKSEHFIELHKELEKNEIFRISVDLTLTDSEGIYGTRASRREKRFLYKDTIVANGEKMPKEFTRKMVGTSQEFSINFKKTVQDLSKTDITKGYYVEEKPKTLPQVPPSFDLALLESFLKKISNSIIIIGIIISIILLYK